MNDASAAEASRSSSAGAGEAHRIAIVGSGPSGCYTAQALRRELGTEAAIEIFEALDTPYGLARYGVAADHPGTRAITRQFDRLFDRDGVVLHCGAPIGGTGLPLHDLREQYDAVVLAAGLPDDLPLDLDGADLTGVVGAGRVLRTLNGHPELRMDPQPLGPVAVIVGAGNVSMDAVRLLSRPAAELAGSGIDETALAAFTQGLRTLHVLSRSLPDDAKADLAMLREIAAIGGVSHRLHLGAAPSAPTDPVPSDSAPIGGEREALLREMADRADDGAEPRLRIEWWFGYQPARIAGDSRVSGIVIAPRSAPESASEILLGADSVITAVGFTRTPDDLGPFPGDGIAATGRVSAGLYAAGWLRRGPRGTIASQRGDARELAGVIAAELRTARRQDRDAADAPAPAVLTWPVHSSFLSYLHRLEDFTVTASGEAGYSESSGVRIVGAEHGGVFTAEHGVVLRAHDGALSLHLESLRIEDDVLWIKDPLGDEGERLRLAELQEIEAPHGSRRFSTRLTPEAEPLFGFVYPPGTEFAPLTLAPLTPAPRRGQR